MYVIGDDGYQNVLVFALMLNSLILDNNKNLKLDINWSIMEYLKKPCLDHD